MAQAIPKQSDLVTPISEHVAQRIKEALLIAVGGVSLFLLIALISHHPSDPSWSHTGSSDIIHNQGGLVGAWVADIALYLCGQFAYLFPFMLGYCGWLIFREGAEEFFTDYFHVSVRFVGCVTTLVTGCGLFWVRGNGPLAELPHHAGGILGDVVGSVAFTIFGDLGGVLLMIALFLTGVTLFTGLSWIWLVDSVGAHTVRAYEYARLKVDDVLDHVHGVRARRQRVAVFKAETEKQELRGPRRIEPRRIADPPSLRFEEERQVHLFKAAPLTALPELSLLDSASATRGGYSAAALEAMSRQVELKLKDFGIEAEVVAVHPGPVITRFELQPAAGVKVSRITNLAKDLARALSTISVRVVEVIPGKSVIGLEIPNETRELVTLSDILKSEVYHASGSKLTLALGKDISGQPAVVDLAKMPHLLVAGTTGAGKSVALNAMILSLLYKSTPADVRLIMIDPKMLELSVYEGIPTLLAPVVTDMKESANALRWCVAEMERRYRLMATLGVRNIGGFNRKVLDAADKGKPLTDPLFIAPEVDELAPELETLPYIVVIVDELADLMMVVGKKVEVLIARLAQKARAAGIHLILATQRPSRGRHHWLDQGQYSEPHRISGFLAHRFAHHPRPDGRGGLARPRRHAVPATGHRHPDTGARRVSCRTTRCTKWCSGSRTVAIRITTPRVLSGPVDGAEAGADAVTGVGGDEQDELYDHAVSIVAETRRASVSGIQRRLKIGYNRAARMVEEMEHAGIVGALQSNGSRDVLIRPPPD